MPKFVIERDIPGAGNLSDTELQEISRKSVAVLKGMGPEIQWLQSYVTGDKVYCVYLAPDEAAIREHAKRGGFPANRISAVRRQIVVLGDQHAQRRERRQFLGLGFVRRVALRGLGHGLGTLEHAEQRVQELHGPQRFHEPRGEPQASQLQLALAHGRRGEEDERQLLETG